MDTDAHCDVFLAGVHINDDWSARLAEVRIMTFSCGAPIVNTRAMIVMICYLIFKQEQYTNILDNHSIYYTLQILLKPIITVSQIWVSNPEIFIVNTNY